MSELITDEMVEAAHRARLSAQIGGAPIANYEYESLRSDIEVQWMRAALEAAAPLIAGRALRDAADDLDLPGSPATGYYASEQVSGYNDAERDTEAWLVKRAARIEEEVNRA